MKTFTFHFNDMISFWDFFGLWAIIWLNIGAYYWMTKLRDKYKC